jgi:hypothetical protein
MNYGQYRHSATVLTNGQYSVAALNDAELYDPSTRAWTMTGGMIDKRAEHTASFLTNGTVFIERSLDGDLQHELFMTWKFSNYIKKIAML